MRRGLSVAAHLPRPTDLLALMQRCGHDPRVVAECVRPLWPSLADASPALRHRLRDAVRSAWPNHYDIGEAEDIPFTLALLLYQVRAYADAQALFEASLRRYGDDGATRWNLALCHVALGEPAKALAAFRRARALGPDLPAAGLAVTKAVRVRERGS
jgi:tetratricopeptide (TPR) repeat protein